MASYLTLSQRAVISQKNKKKIEKKRMSKLIPVALLIVAVSISGLAYIFRINHLATMGYDINSKEKEIEELKKTNEFLKIEAAQLKSMHSLEDNKERLKMIKPQEVSYIEVESPVALK